MSGRRNTLKSRTEVDPDTGCWIWLGSTQSNGYGRVAVNGRSVYAHRASYAEFCGEIPDGMDVCHTCDVRNCINPDHLFLGTRADNMRDCKVKGRTARGDMLPDRSGENSSSAKLTWRSVRAIRRLHKKGVSAPELAAAFEMDASGIRLIINRKTWKESADVGQR